MECFIIRQNILINEFASTFVADGSFGKFILAAINSVDEPRLFEAILEKRMKFLNDIVIARSKNQKLLKSWQNRINNLVEEYGG